MMKFYPLRVAAIEQAAEDAVCLALEIPAELRDAFRHQAGQHVTVRRRIDGVEERRTYSIASIPGAEPIRLGIRLQPQGRMSQLLGQSLRVGETLEVAPPMGRFRAKTDLATGGRYVAFAAGSGITPVISLAAEILGRSADSHVTLFYGNRSLARSMFVEDLFALKNRYVDRFDLHFIMSREPQAAQILNGRLDAAKLGELAGRLFDPQSVDEYFVCGPGSMVQELREALAGLSGGAPVQVERFATDGAIPTPVPVAAQAAGAAQEAVATVTVTMDGRQRSFQMTDADSSVLQAAERAGLELPYSCRSGICATCRVKVVQGEAAMTHNIALEPWEIDAGFVLCCQAQPKTPTLSLTYDEK